MVSDSLGVPAVRKHFDPTLRTFPHRRIAKEAFLAGNDLLLLSQFDLGNSWPEQFENVRDTLAFFREEYRANPAFAARVDLAVAKIVGLKLKLYPDFSLDAVRAHPNVALQVCGLGGVVTQSIANSAITLLYPDPNALPAPPRQGDQIVIFTDARPVRECFTDRCQPFSPLGATAVQEAILRIYGPDGTGQVSAGDITSLSFGQLKAFLTEGDTQYDVGELLARADWILLAPQDLNPVKGPNSDALKLFLNHAVSALSSAKLVVLAFNAPYYLDTTETSKLSLYLGAYGKPEPFVEAAVRALFGELTPWGTSPVDVEGINYELARQLSPDPEQLIPLVQLAPALDTVLQVPVSVDLRAGPIRDRNGRAVPDGTLATFYAEYADGAYSVSESAAVQGGLAEITIYLNAAGKAQIRVESEEATRSQSVSLSILLPASATPASTSTPMLSPSPVAPAPTATPTPTFDPTPSPSSTPTGENVAPVDIPARAVDGPDLLIAACATLLVVMSGAGILGWRRRERVLLLRSILLPIIGGMGAYILYALRVVRPETWGMLPEAAWTERAAMAGVVITGSLLCLLLVVGIAGLSMLRTREP
jgi:beta-N-acetylhexosaminidase